MNKDFLTIKEFAEAVGVSQQAVYKQLNNKLKPYLKVVDNKKMLNKSALELFKPKEDTTNVEQRLINMLQDELNKKNEQIERLQQLLDHAQQLHAMEKQRVLELECKVEEQKQQEQKKKWWQFGKK